MGKKVFAAVAGIGAVACIALFGLNYNSQASALFEDKEQELRAKYIKHIAIYGRVMNGKDDFEERFQLFKTKDAFINEWNAQPDEHTVGHNIFSDYTQEEYRVLLGAKQESESAEETEEDRLMALNAPSSIDWRSKGAVTGVKNQAQCGSCWSFSATGAQEGANKIRHGKLVSLSEQRLVDCDKQSYGCSGGFPGGAISFLAQGANTEAEYPYDSGHGDDRKGCRHNPTIKGLSGNKRVGRGKAAAVAALAKQPVSIVIEADRSTFQQYHSGVIKRNTGCGTRTDHAVLAVGYNTAGGYFLVKNSWGTGWGDKGYVKLEMASDTTGTCGMYTGINAPTL